MSKYVKYTHQCDVCECALFEETKKLDNSVYDMPYPSPTAPGIPVAPKWNFDTCDDCRKELEATLETLKTLMQLKRQNGEAPAEEVKMSRKEWRQAHREEVENEKQVLKQKYEPPPGLEAQSKDELMYRMKRMQEYMQKQERSSHVIKPEHYKDMLKSGNGY